MTIGWDIETSATASVPFSSRTSMLLIEPLLLVTEAAALRLKGSALYAPGPRVNAMSLPLNSGMLIESAAELLSWDTVRWLVMLPPVHMIGWAAGVEGDVGCVDRGENASASAIA